MGGHLCVINLEVGGGQDAGLDLAQGLANLVHGLVHSHDRSPSCPFQPPMLAIRTGQHAIYQLPACSPRLRPVAGHQ